MDGVGMQDLQQQAQPVTITVSLNGYEHHITVSLVNISILTTAAAVLSCLNVQHIHMYYEV